MTRALLLLLALTVPASAHDAGGWAYPWECCGGHDCHPVPCDQIVETPTGFTYDGVTFEKSAERPSQDRFCHVCILGSGENRTGRCLFTLQGT